MPTSIFCGSKDGVLVDKRYLWPIFHSLPLLLGRHTLARAVALTDHVTVDNRPQLANSAACNIQVQTRLSRPRRLPLPPDPLIVFHYASKLSSPTCWTCNSNLGDDAVFEACFSVSTQPTIDAPTLILSLTSLIHQYPHQLAQPIHDHLLSPANSP
jgi:hypothetical protein